MRPVKIVNACVHNLLIGKTLIKFDVIMQVSFGIIFTKLLCQILCQGRNQTSTVLCTFTATQFLLYNSFTYIPIGKQHCLTGSTIGSLLSRGNNAFNFCNNWLVWSQMFFHHVTSIPHNNYILTCFSCHIKTLSKMV